MYFLILLLSFSLQFLGSFAFGATTCSADKVVGSCDVLEKLGVDVNGSKELNLPKFEDGSIIYNDLGLLKKEKIVLIEPSPAQGQRSVQLAEKVRDALRNLIVGDTRKELWTAEQSAMKARLESVKISMADEKDEACNSSPVSTIDPNASYRPWTHSVVLCPSVARLAPAAQMMLVAHEFGHVISPCAMNRDQYKVNPQKLVPAAKVEQCLGGSSDVEFAQTMFPESPNRANLSRLDDLSPRYRNVVSKLTACGALERIEDESGINESVLFGSLSSCLFKNYAKNHENYLKAVTGSEGKRSSNLQQAPPADLKSRKCMGIFEEHFAEAVGAKVFGSMLTGNSGAAATARVGLVQMQGYACAERSRPKQDPGKMFRYPSSVDRVYIQMSDAAVQAALNCELPKSNVCTLDQIDRGSQIKPTSKIRGVSQ